MVAFGFFVAVALAVSVSVVTSQEIRDGLPVVYGYQSGQKCPAEAFFNDCNRCRCSGGGYEAACTRIGCSEQPEIGTVGSKPLYAPTYKQGNKCPAKYFFDGCNNCSCEDGVTALCTKKFCKN